MVVTLGVIVAVMLLAAGLVAGRFAAARACRIAGTDATTPERVHRLQRLSLIVLSCYFLGFFIVGAAAAAVAAGRDDRPAWAVVIGAAGFLGLIAGMVLSSRAIRRAMATVRNTKLRSRGRRRQSVAGVAVGLGWGFVVVIGNVLVPAHGAGHAIGLACVYVVALLLLTSVLAPLLVVRISSKPLTGSELERLVCLADSAGVKVRGFRILDTRGQKIANAAQMGTIPGFRYVLLTDYLLGNLTPEQIDAVVAHEPGSKLAPTASPQ